MSNIIVIYDTEATCWAKKDGTSSWWSEDWQEPEIIQIAAIKLDSKTFQEVGAPFDILIAPTINPILSPHCEKLTSISNDDIKNYGIDFKTASAQFNAYCQGHDVFSYGPDHNVLNYNRKELYSLEKELPQFHGGDLKPLFLSIDPNTKGVNSGGLAQHFNLSININQHYALDDCRSIAAALAHHKNRKDVQTFFKP